MQQQAQPANPLGRNQRRIVHANDLMPGREKQMQGVYAEAEGQPPPESNHKGIRQGPPQVLNPNEGEQTLFVFKKVGREVERREIFPAQLPEAEQKGWTGCWAKAQGVTIIPSDQVSFDTNASIVDPFSSAMTQAPKAPDTPITGEQFGAMLKAKEISINTASVLFEVQERAINAWLKGGVPDKRVAEVTEVIADYIDPPED